MVIFHHTKCFYEKTFHHSLRLRFLKIVDLHMFADICVFKAYNRNTITMCEICSKLTKTPESCHCC